MSDPSDSKRLPRNAGPIPFPSNRHNTVSPPFEDFVDSLPTASPSIYSEFNVVLDDGTMQKRTVSLSTFALEEKDENDHKDKEEDDDQVIDTTTQYDLPVQGTRKAR